MRLGVFVCVYEGLSECVFTGVYFMCAIASLLYACVYEGPLLVFD
jgi:hypothetical protein